MKVEFRLNKYKDAAELLRTEEFHEQFVVDFVMKADIVTVASGERFSVKIRELVVVGPTGRPEVKLYGDWGLGLNTAAQLHGASLSVLKDLERAVKAHVTPERVICFLGPWIRRAEFEAVVSKGAIQAAFIPNAVVEALADWRMGQAVVWAMEAMRAQGLDVDVVVRTDEVRIRWTKD